MAKYDVSNITGRGTVVTGSVESGALNVGESVKIVGHSRVLLDSDIFLLEKDTVVLRYEDQTIGIGLVSKL